jgi:two-component system response regulator ChvI
MFLTGYGQVDNERQAFARGAIDFMDKTRGVEILARRLKLVANHPPGKPEADACVACGKLLLRPIDCRAYWNEIDVCLTSTEYKIVRLLVSNIGHFQTYRDIYNLQYYQGFVAGQRGKGHQTNIRSTIKRIRRKFCALDPTFAEIENSGGIGYRWRNRLQ